MSPTLAMYTFWIFLSAIACSYSKPLLLTFVVPSTVPASPGPQDVVAIDPSTGNATKLNYHLPTGDKLCARIDQKRGLIYVLYETTNFVKYRMSDGHVVDTYNISYDIISPYFIAWDYDPDLNLLYGTCLKPDNVAIHWTYTWCYVAFDDNGVGKLHYESFVSGDSEPPNCGYCSKIHMNRNTFSTGEYWYTLSHSIIVKNVSSPNGSPWNTLWTVEDNANFDALLFAALVTGKINEYVIVVHCPSGNQGDNSFVVAKLTPDGQETILAKLPSYLSSQAVGAVPWAFDSESQMLYILMQSTGPMEYELEDTLVKVNLSLPPESAVETVKVPFDLLGYDPKNYIVYETHFVDK